MTATFKAPGSTTYNLMVDGANFGRFGLQAVSSASVRVFIGTSAPAENTDNYLLLSDSGTRELVSNLAATDKVYVKGGSAGGTIARGFKESRT